MLSGFSVGQSSQGNNFCSTGTCSTETYGLYQKGLPIRIGIKSTIPTLIDCMDLRQKVRQYLVILISLTY